MDFVVVVDDMVRRIEDGFHVIRLRIDEEGAVEDVRLLGVTGGQAKMGRADKKQ